jgi:hypothetical protein
LAGGAAEETEGAQKVKGDADRPFDPDYLPLMILPQVHLRKPCYDFYFL